MVDVDSAPCPGAEGEDPGRGGGGRDEGTAARRLQQGSRGEDGEGAGGGAAAPRRRGTRPRLPWCSAVQCSDKTRLFVQLFVFIDASSG